MLATRARRGSKGLNLRHAELPLCSLDNGFHFGQSAWVPTGDGYAPNAPLAQSPGWYADGNVPGSLRWWDGSRWTPARVVPVPDYRGRVLGKAAAIAGAIGVILMLVTFPFVYGDPVEGEEKVVPEWTHLVGAIGIGFMGLALVCLMLGGFVRARRPGQ